MTEAELAEVRALLSDAQIINFLRAADEPRERPTTVLAINQALNNGRPLDKVLCEDPNLRVPPRYRTTKTMKVERLGPNTFRIHFGGGSKNAGDGGTWLVEYNPDGTVRGLSMESYWHK